MSKAIKVLHLLTGTASALIFTLQSAAPYIRSRAQPASQPDAKLPDRDATIGNRGGKKKHESAAMLTHDEAYAALIEALTELGVETDTPQAATVEEEIASWAKTLVVKDKKTKALYAVTAPSGRAVNMKALAKVLGAKELRMADPKDVAAVLGVERGCITAMSVYNDAEGKVATVLDSEMMSSPAPLRMCSGCDDAKDHSQHKIASVTPQQLAALLQSCNHQPTLVDMSGAEYKVVAAGAPAAIPAPAPPADKPTDTKPKDSKATDTKPKDSKAKDSKAKDSKAPKAKASAGPAAVKGFNVPLPGYPEGSTQGIPQAFFSTEAWSGTCWERPQGWGDLPAPSPVYRFLYFDARGVAETVRHMLALKQVPYEDVRYPVSMKDGKFHKPEADADKEAGLFASNMGRLPLLEVVGAGAEVAQSKSIERFVAAQHGLMGRGPLEAALVDALCEHIRDIKDAYQKVKNIEDAEKKAAGMEEWWETSFAEWMQKLEPCVGLGGYCVGSSTTLADISLLVFMLDFFGTDPGEVPKQFLAPQCPNIATVLETVGNLPEIVKWRAERPQTMF